MNAALKRGKFFEKPWKVGIVKILYKGNNKVTQNLKSYRPLTLLPVLGTTNKTITNRILMINLGIKRKDSRKAI